jgi:Uma2 family endonuclease
MEELGASEAAGKRSESALSGSDPALDAPGFALGVPGLDEQRLSYAEFLKLPSGNQHIEWVNGEVVVLSAVTPVHERVSELVHSAIATYSQAENTGTVRRRPFQMKAGPGLPGRSPDVIFVAAENAGRLREAFLDGPADLVVEVMSEQSARIDCGEKYGEYQRAGVGEYWLIDPQKQQAEFYQLGPDGYFEKVQLSDGVYHSKALKGFQLRESSLWEGHEQEVPS